MAAAYAALVSVMQTIDLIEHHPFPPISLDKQQVESLTEIVTFLQEFLEGYNSPFADRHEADPLEMRIVDAAYAAEDVIETHIVDRILPRRKKMGFLNCFRILNMTSTDLYGGLQKVIGRMDLIKKEVMEIVAEKEVVQEYSASAGSSTSSLSRSNNTMLGFDDLVLQLMDKLTDGRVDRQVIPIVGMGGIGKTTLAKNIYERPSIKAHFDICAWATISQQYNTKEILCKILSQGNKEGSESLSKLREDEVGLALHKYLSYRRFLIVLDDMWSVEAWEKIQHFFPENGNGSRIMVTTRLSNLGSQLDKDYGLKMKFLDEDSSWDMFSNIVFGGKRCPLELEEIGKKILQSCRGLPLSILVMGGVLQKLEHTKKCWKSIRRSLNSIVNSENDDHCLKILKLSYNHLPVHLKPCFLYMGVFDEDSVIRVSRLIMQWVSEGFLKPVRGQSLETTAEEYLKELIDRNLILVHELGSTGKVKYCKIHDLLRDLCLREAQKEMFYHVVGQHSPRGSNSQRRIVIPRNTSKKKVLDALESTPRARTYMSDFLRVPLLPKLRLLTLRTYYFDRRNEDPLKKLVELVNLRFLFVEAPWYIILPSINLLWSLQSLIVFYPVSDVSAPVEIWKMPELRHVKFYGNGFHLPDPPSDNDIIMENLQTLVGVRDFKFDEEVIRRIPNIKRLRINYSFRINENESYDDHYCFHNIERLRKLESLDCKFNLRGDFVEKVTFPHSLKSLTLEMMRGSFEYMSRRISSFPLLQKLKLCGGWASTSKWTTVEGQFPSLKYLSLVWGGELEYWTTESSHFPCLEHLCLCEFRKLKEIPTEIGEISTLQSVALVACSETAVKSMKAIVEEQEGLQGEVPFKVEVVLREKNEELQNLANHNFQVTAY